MATNKGPAICRGARDKPGCGEQIRWIKNSKTLRMEPIDAEPTSAGNIVIEGGLAVHLSAERAKSYEGEKFISHFATCPQAGQFRAQKPNRAPSRPKDIRLGGFDTPASAAVGRIDAAALDQTVECLVDEFCAKAHELLGTRPTEDELQHLWKVWQRKHQDRGVDKGTLELVAKRAKQRLHPAEVTAA